MVPQVGQNTAIILLCADATKTQSFSQGGPARLTGNNNIDAQSFFVSASTPIAAHIPIKVKEKSWANQFIEFHKLLSPKPLYTINDGS